VSPVIDLSAVADPVIRFNQELRLFAGGLEEFGNVDLSTDGGATWETVLQQILDPALGPQETVIGIPQAAGEPDVRLRFHYGNANFEFWWQIDNVTVGTCTPEAGGLVAGLVADRNTGAGINGATVTGPVDSVRSSATQDDQAQPDGFYWLFSPATGDQPFTASSGNYASQTAQVNVESDRTTRQDFSLPAGRLTVEPASLAADVPLGASRQRAVTITNDGTAPVALDLHERGGDFEILRADGSRLSEQEILSSPGAPVRRVEVDVPFAQLAGAPTEVQGAQEQTAQLPHPEPWIDLPNFPRTVFDNNVVVVDGRVYSFSGLVGGAGSSAAYVFDPVARTWTQLANMPGRARLQAAEGVIDGRIYLVSGWGDLDTTTLIYDPATGEWTTGVDAPAGRAAAGNAVLDGDLYVVGGCTSGQCTQPAADVFRYDPASDRWETLASYPVPAAWQSCGAIAGLLYCAGGVTTGGVATTRTYRYDPVVDAWERVADMPFDLWGGGHAGADGRLLVAAGVTGNSTVVTNQGFAYDPATDAWEDLPATNHTLFRSGSACGLYKVGGAAFSPSSGFIPDDAVEVLPGFDQCAADLPWLSVNPATATLDPGDSLVATVSLDGDVAQPGSYTGAIRIREDTPYQVTSVDVTMTVTAPASWGTIAGTVTAVSCRGDQAPLPDATVQLSTGVLEQTLFTNELGEYAYWLDGRHSPVMMIVASDGYQPQVRQTVVAAGEVTVEDWTLRRVCASAIGGPM
jgi:N-acetylneuraminic acid mutarotase